MKRLGILIALIVLAAFSLTACDSGTATTPVPTDTVAAGSTTPPTTTGKSSMVTVQNFSFSPGTITIKVGDTVEWDGKSGDHEVKNDDSSSVKFDGPISTGGKFTFTFTTAGTFHYHCAIHPTMTGTVVVTS